MLGLAGDYLEEALHRVTARLPAFNRRWVRGVGASSDCGGREGEERVLGGSICARRKPLSGFDWDDEEEWSGEEFRCGS